MFKIFFQKILYQPVLNILVFTYNLIPIYKDMGIALIIIVVLMDLILSPLRKGVERSEEEQEKIMEELKNAEEKYKGNIIKLKAEKKKVLKKHRKIINLRGFDLFIEGVYFITFWWVFSKGLPKQEWNLLYSWVKHPVEPVNLTFLNLFNLTVVSPMLNLISAIGLFIILFLKNWWKSKKTTRENYLVLFWAPFAAYFISSKLPAGQEFFFTITEILYFLRLIIGQMKKIARKIGLTKETLPIKDFTDSAWKQISGS